MLQYNYIPTGSMGHVCLPTFTIKKSTIDVVKYKYQSHGAFIEAFGGKIRLSWPRPFEFSASCSSGFVAANTKRCPWEPDAVKQQNWRQNLRGARRGKMGKSLSVVGPWHHNLKYLSILNTLQGTMTYPLLANRKIIFKNTLGARDNYVGNPSRVSLKFDIWMTSTGQVLLKLKLKKMSKKI